MHLPDQVQLKFTSTRLWEILNRIQESLQVSNFQIADWMALTSREYVHLQQNERMPRLYSLMSLSQALNLSFDMLVTGNIDFKALYFHYFGYTSFLPEKYTVSALSKRRTAINLLNYVESFHGWRKRASILRRFQMNESIFLDPDAYINICFAIDIATYLGDLGHPLSELKEMGRFSTITHKHSPIGTALEKLESTHELYEYLLTGLTEKLIEQNYSWHLDSLGKDNCRITGKISSHLVASVGDRYAKNPLGCYIRTGFWEAVPGYINRSNATVIKTACVSQGDPTCVFEVDYSNTKKMKVPALIMH